MKRSTPSQEQVLIKIGWLAGIIDGEGSLSHYYFKRKNRNLKKSPAYGIVIVNTDTLILNEVENILRKLDIYFSRNIKSSKRINSVEVFRSIKPCFVLSVRRRLDTERLLKIIYPYLIGEKKAKAKSMLNFFKLNPFNSKKQVRV